MPTYLRFQEAERKPKTSVYNVISLTRGDMLGEIFWHGPWRGYVFQPEYGTIWSAGCLKELQDFLLKLSKERRPEAA